MAGFSDHFGAVAGSYADFRPRYPAALFAWLATQCAAHELAWDCGAGSGQASVALAAHFARVQATDASAEQIAHAGAACAMQTKGVWPQLLTYLGSWSATARYPKVNGADPLPALQRKLLPLWAAPAQTRTVSWPLARLSGRLD